VGLNFQQAVEELILESRAKRYANMKQKTIGLSQRYVAALRRHLFDLETPRAAQAASGSGVVWSYPRE